MLLLDQEEVGDEDPEQRSDEGAEHVERVVDDLRILVQVPRRDEDRADGRDHAAHPPADQLRRHVREIEGGRDEVRDDVDADRRRHEGEGAEHDRVDVVEPAHGLDGIDDHLPNTGSVDDVVITQSSEKPRKLTGRPQKLPALTASNDFP